MRNILTFLTQRGEPMNNKIWITLVVLMVLAMPFAIAKDKDDDAWDKLGKWKTKILAVLSNDAAQDAKIAALEAKITELEARIDLTQATIFSLHPDLPPAPGFYTGDSAPSDPPSTPEDPTSPPVES